MSTKKQFFKPLHNYSISLWTYLWNMLYIGLLFCTDFSYGIQSGRLMAPSSITTLSGDLHVQLQLYKAEDTPINNTILGSKNVQTNTLVISKFLQNKNGTQLKQVIENIPVFPDPRHNVTQITVPCETFSTAGSYELQFVTNLKMSTNENNVTKIVATTLMPLQDERLQQTLDVRWPRANIVLSKTRLNTYPETAVQVRLSFSDVACARAYQTSRIPEFWLELLYCGKDSSCFFISALNISKSNIFFAEQIRGFPAQHNLTLNCELFGLAGIYAVQLRPMRPDLLMNFPLIRRLITVDWSDKFVFNVFARSIFPCDPHTGIGVLFEYPRCILDQGDRVRVYAKLRADVASLKPPTTLHYVAEQRVVKNQYSLHFSCDLFTEKYVEYCFVYVSQAISGAVADVRMDCVPTLPVAESDTGGWGPWSDWTPCSAKCLGGTRNRYRFCDSPPPRYGAKFCEGPSVETEKCEQNTDDTWDCIQDKSLSGIEIANKKKISQVIGPGCRCGCIVHVGSSKSKRMIAGALQSCPGKSFWLVQADHQKRLSMNFKFLRLPCASQYIRLRDGASLSSTLLHEIQGTEYVHLPEGIGSTGAQVLLETYAGDQITHFSNTQNATNSKLISHNPLNMYCNGGFTVEVEEIDTNKSLIGNTFLATSRQLFPTRDIKRIIRRSGLSIVHISVLTFASIIIFISTILGFQFIRRYQKYHLAMAKNCEDGLCLNPLPTDGSSNSLNLLPSRAVSTTTLISEVICFVKMRSKPSVRHSILRESVDAEYLNKDAQTNQLVNQHDKNDEEELNCEQQIAVEELSTAEAPELSSTASADTCSAVVAVPAGNHSRVFVVGVKPKRKSLQNKESQLRSESIDTCSINTPCNSPCTLSPTSMTSNECYDGVALKMLYSELRAKRQMAKLTSSKATSLDNAHLSPRKSVINIATIKPTNLKESKEQQNRRKLLSRPNSDMSLGQQDSEMEMDYYDYDVINAAAAPGSYFSMDPAHLVWIPPFEGHEIILESPTTPTTTNSSIEINKTETFFKENNKYGHFFFPTPSSDGSITPTNTNNTTTSTPTSLELLSLNKSNLLLKAVSPSEVHNFRNTLIQKTICADATLKGTRSLCNIASKMSETNTAELSSVKSVERDMMNESYTEKETSVVKSANDLQNYLALDDIKFADDSEPELENQTEVLRV